jgi:hypothetical protein
MTGVPRSRPRAARPWAVPWGLCLGWLLLLLAIVRLPVLDARTALAPEERQHVKNIISKLTKVKGGQHGSFAYAGGNSNNGNNGNNNHSNNNSNSVSVGSGVGGGAALSGGKAAAAGGAGAVLGLAPAPAASLSLGELKTPALSIEPASFSFGSHYTCIAKSQDFELKNLSPDPGDQLEVYSVAAGSLHFHVANFSPLTLMPNKTRAIRIMFLPYLAGATSVVVVIQTSLGGFLLRLSGEGVSNPYGVKGFTGVRVPMGITYNPAVQMYNPFDEPLHIKEIFTTEGFLHLALPDFVDDVDKVEEVNAVSTSASIWHMQPREIKDVIELSFRSHTPGTYRGFLHVKTNLDNLVVPIDIVVLSGGLHAMPEELHFGATVPGEAHTIPVTLLNSDRVPVTLLEVYTRNIDDTISFSCVLRPPASVVQPATVVVVFFCGVCFQTQ